MKSFYLSLMTGFCLLWGAVPGLCTSETADYIPPVAVCEDQLNVSLTSNGTAIVLAQSFDQGSYDNYCLAAIKVKKTYDPYDDFGPWVEFDCDDIGQLVSVELKAIDCAGNTNSCWVDVWVEDKIDPGIWCPYDKTIACEDLYNWNVMGQATASDACGIASLTHQDIDNTGSCGTGYITRIWKATDLYGNMSSCTQTIHVIDNTPVVVYFPPDYVSYDCVSEDDLNPENLPAPFNGPQVLYEDCEIIATSYEDWVFTAAPNSCVKIIRRWKVIDWCTYEYGGNQGYWEDTQILKIQDTIPPTATCPADFTVSTGYGDCVADIQLPLPTDIQDCLPNVDISIHGDLGSGTIHTDIPIGEYEVGYLLEDGCNNKSTCHLTVSVVDGQSPGPVCLNGVSLSLMANGMVELWASDIEQGSSFDACTDYSHLKFRLGLEPQPGQTTPPADDFLVFDCDDVGSNVIALWVGDASGNWAYCLTYAQVQDNQGVCPGVIGGADSTFIISGLVADEWGNRIEGVNLYTDSTNYWSVTDTAGAYNFGAMPMGEDYIIDPIMLSSPLEGLSLSDIIILAKHLMGVDTLDTPYQHVAADVNRSGYITQEDMMLMHTMLLGLETAFADSLSWRFIPASYVWPSQNPLLADFPESITIDELEENIEDADFIAVKLGDLDGSSTQGSGDLTSDIENRNLLLTETIALPNVKLAAGETVEVPVYLNSNTLLEGMQIQLQLDGIELLQIEKSNSEDLLLSTNNTEEAVISWVPAGQIGTAALFRLQITSERDIELSEALELHSSSKAGMTLNGVYQEANLQLAFLPGSAQFNLHTVFPNPFKASTSFAFEQAKAGTTQLTIWSTNGQVVYQEERHYDAGRHRWEVNARELGNQGTFIYQLSNGSEKVSGQLLLMGE
jgi:hypothetical protein